MTLQEWLAVIALLLTPAIPVIISLIQMRIKLAENAVEIKGLKREIEDLKGEDDKIKQKHDNLVEIIIKDYKTRK